ncbi:alpha/beta fold hydrolase [Kineobactrum salinum]|uniref:Alpha/beta hydrolase n=1 Tax=Kineobactrum salinum TaxID=2708301 RepID=A0A6C0U2A6_9GAMM|nr:alpha/beta hydrolase [Kineobactrum salinum]QIB66058.1 alpha/beta hydrolase [Kineobactrum salinum]
MTTLQSRFLVCRERKLHFLEGGTPARPAIIIWHGVTGTCEDHRELATRLAQRYHVIVPDSPGCGLSEWISPAPGGASLGFHADIAEDLLRQLRIDTVAWIGSSKGGGLGIVVAGRDNAITVSHLILNDVGVSLPGKTCAALGQRLAEPPVFQGFEEFVAHVQRFLARSGVHRFNGEAHKLALSWSRRTDAGGFSYHYDPALARQFSEHPEDFDLWSFWDRITARTLLLQGEDSIVAADEIAAMCRRGPGCSHRRRPGGHVTFLDSPEEQDIIMEFLQTGGENHGAR